MSELIITPPVPTFKYPLKEISKLCVYGECIV